MDTLRRRAGRPSRRPLRRALIVAGALPIALAGLAVISTPSGASPTPAAPSPAAVSSARIAAPERLPGVTYSFTPGPLIDHGGPVQAVPELYIVWWGWTSDPHGEQPYLLNFLNSIGSSSWLSTVLQYGGGPTPLVLGTWSDGRAIPAAPTDAQIQAEGVRAAHHFGITASVNDEVIVATPTGHSSPATFAAGDCSYHGHLSAMPNLTYTDFPYMSDAGTTCGENLVNGGTAGVLDGVSIIAGHELAESITDPLANAWYDASGNEVADKCQWYDLTDITTGLGTFAVQPLWSNAANACTPSWPGGWSPVATAPGVANSPPSFTGTAVDQFVGFEHNNSLYMDLDASNTWTGPSEIAFQNGTNPASKLRPSLTIDPVSRIPYLAYTDASTGTVLVSTWLGANNWSNPSPVGQSSAVPAICAVNGLLSVAFRGKSNNNVYLSINSGSGFGAPVKLPGASTTHNPAVACDSSLAGDLVAWTGPGGKIQYDLAGIGVSSVLTLSVTSTAGPSLAINGDTVYLGWLTSSNGVEYSSSTNPTASGATWANAQSVPGAVTPVQPSLAYLDGTLLAGWATSGGTVLYSKTQF